MMSLTGAKRGSQGDLTMSAVELKHTCPGSGDRSNDAAPFRYYADPPC